jgi:hypothetical protein
VQNFAIFAPTVARLQVGAFFPQKGDRGSRKRYGVAFEITYGVAKKTDPPRTAYMKDMADIRCGPLFRR